MPRPTRPPLKSVNFSSPDAAKKSIHVLFTQSNVEPVLRWMDLPQTLIDDDLLRYVWMQSIRSNLTEPVARWMDHHHPGKKAELTTGLDMLKILHSPRAWNSLKTQGLIPTLSYEAIAQISGSWNRSMLKMAKSLQKGISTELKPYFDECAMTQIDFLDTLVPSYRTKTALLRLGMDYGQYEVRIGTLPITPMYSRLDAVYTMMEARAQAMAQSKNPDMWMLASMDEKNVPLSCYLSRSPKLSNWWQPLLADFYPQEFKNEVWSRYLSKTTSDERPVPDSIMVAYHLTAGTTKIRDQIPTLMATADTPQDIAFEDLDLSAIAFDME